ncbi:MAG: MFS transporter [Chthoniobacterales bacterium]
MNKEEKRIIFLSSVGGMLEFYDFTIYGLFSVYFAEQFFPSHNNLTAIISSYAVFSVGYIVRPLGGILFSHIGDEIGRKTVMVVTMLLMGFASLGLGLLPTYASIGFWAPTLILLLRLVQGLAIGGELPSMIVYIAESLPKQRGIAIGALLVGTVGGLIPGMSINFLITHYLTHSQIYNYGWRIPFILGSFLCFFGYQIRNKLHETAVFNNLKKRVSFPLGELLRNHLSNVFIGFGLVSMTAPLIVLGVIFMPTYLTNILKLNPTHASNSIFFITVLYVPVIYAMGLLSHRFSPYVLMRNFTLLLIVGSAAFYFMLFQGHNLTLTLVIFALFSGLPICLPSILISYLFPPQIRLSGVALSYNLANAFFGGLTPTVVTSMIKWTHMPYTAPFLWVLFIACIALFSLACCRKYLDFTVKQTNFRGITQL